MCVVQAIKVHLKYKLRVAEAQPKYGFRVCSTGRDMLEVQAEGVQYKRGNIDPKNRMRNCNTG